MSGWGTDSSSFQNGKLSLVGKNWENGITRDQLFTDYQGVIVDFQYSKGSVLEMYVDYGNWFTDAYKRFGIYVDNNSPQVNVFSGKNALGGARLSGNLRLKPDTVYTLMMTVLPGGEFFAAIWDPSDPSKAVYYHETIGKKWSDLQWRFAMNAATGNVLFDNFREVTFEGLK